MGFVVAVAAAEAAHSSCLGMGDVTVAVQHVLQTIKLYGNSIEFFTAC